MALLLRRNFKLVNLVRLLSSQRTNQSIWPKYANVGASRSNANKLYATAAHNYKVNYAADGFEDNSKSVDIRTRDDGDIDKALHDIDYAVRRTGRTVLESVHSVFQAIENVGFATESQSLYLLRCCGLLRLEAPQKRVELVNKLWEKFKSLGVNLNCRHFNALLKVYLECNENFFPSDILISMEQLNVEPNQETYCCLIEKYCRDGNLNGANEVLEYLKEKNISVNEAIFNSLIKGHMKINDVEGSKDIMEVMRKSSISPSSRTYTILACCFADKKNFEELDKVLTEANSFGISFENNDYMQILLSAASNGNADLVDKLLQKMNDVYEWRQDFINAAAELVHKGLDNIAFKLIMEISSPEYTTATNNFIKLLIKAEVPVDRVIRYCTEIYDNGYNSFIFTNGARFSVEKGKLEPAVAFFDEMQKRGIPVRTRNFRPLFAANKHSSEGVWRVMKTMAVFGVPLDYTNYRDYILPLIGNEDPQQLISRIEECGHSASCMIDPLFEYYCSKGEIDHALYLIENHSVQVNMYFDLVSFLSHYKKYARNPSAYFTVLKYILETVGLPGQDVNAIRGEQLAAFLRTNPRIFEAFHNSYIGKDCNYDGRSIAICKRILQKNAPDLLRYLRNIGRQNTVSTPTKEISLEEEDKMINSAPASSKLKTLTELLTLNIRNRNIERVNLVKSKFSAQNLPLPPTALAQIFFMECDMGELDAAKKSFQAIKELHPTFKIDTARLIDYARQLLRYSNIDEALSVIENECQEVNSFSASDSLLKSLRRFLNNVVQTGNVDFAKKIQTTLINREGFSDLKRILLEPVIKIFLYKEDFDSCLKEYESCVISYNCSPCQDLLMKKLVLAGEYSKLQTVVDLASKIEGHSKTQLRLALIFLDLDHLQQATKVFQNLGKAIDSGYLIEAGRELLSLNKVTVLQNLLHAIPSVNRQCKEELCNLLLTSYCRSNQYEKCSQILDFMRKENIELSNGHKQLINDLCARNNKPLHFPDVSEMNKSNDPVETLSTNETVLFINFVHQGDGKKALKELETLKKGYVRTIPMEDMSNFIGLLIKDNCLNNLGTITPAMSYIIENSNLIFRPLLEKYSEEGNVEAMKLLANVFPDFSLKKAFFNSFIARAYLNSNRHEDLLSELEARSQKKNKLASVVAFQELMKMSHLEERVVKLAKSYLDANFDLPIAVVWAHYFTSEQYEKAKEISKVTFIPVEKVDSFIFRYVQETENLELGKKYTEFVSGLDYRDRVKERAYGILLDLLVVKQMHEEAVNLVMDAKSKNVDLEKHYKSTLTTLKSSLERENKPVPFSVSVENTS